MTEYTIGEAADILRVTTRTLRHWDHIGLLVPGWRTWADHRLYTDGDLQRAWEILIYREAGVPLREIAKIIAEPATARRALQRQRDILTERIGHLHRMVRAVDDLLQEETTMSIEDRMSLFGDQWKPEYQDEAEQRWGDTPEWEQSQAVQASMSEADWRAVRQEHDECVAALVDAAARGVEPGTDEAREVVEKHRATIARWYPVSAAKQVLLARMYVDDERFAASYQGQAGYLLRLVEAQAAVEGVDLEAVTWE